MELDSVQIGVADLDEATAAYTLLLGVEPVRLAGEVRRFQLGRGAVELEFAPSDPPRAAGDGPDRFYGGSYRVADLETRRERLLGAGVDVSPIRAGMRAGTSVASVRSGTAGVPTLLLQMQQ